MAGANGHRDTVKVSGAEKGKMIYLVLKTGGASTFGINLLDENWKTEKAVMFAEFKIVSLKV